MPCAAPIDTTPVTAPKTFLNWARALSFTTARSFLPSTRGEIVGIIRQAEDAGQRVKWTGSRWSFMNVFAADDVIIESDRITGPIDRALILDRLTLADPSLRNSLFHIKGGTKVFNVNRLLHGLPAAESGGGRDEVGLTCGPGRALPTLGGSGGQSIVGVMATGSHGGDIRLPPIADCVQVIHLIGPGGQEFWIERSSGGLTGGSESDTQAALRAAADLDASAEMCNDVLVRKDDDLFRAALVSVGRMGFVYSLVVRAVPAFKLAETRRADTWQNLRTLVSAEGFAAFTAGTRFLNIIVNPFGHDGVHDCKVAERVDADCAAPSTPPGESSEDFFTWVCRQQDVTWISVILTAAIAVLAVVIGLLWSAIAVMLATATVLLGIPLVGWILAVLTYAAVLVVAAIAVASAVVATAAGVLLAYIAAGGGRTPGELVAAISNFMFSVGLQDVMRSILVGVFNSAYPLVSRTDIGWKVMDTYGYGPEDMCQKVDSMEFAFDVSAATGGGGYIAFVDQVLAIFEELYGRHIAVACLLAIRYTRDTEALIGMSKFPVTCHIEIPVIRNFPGNAEFIERVQRAAIAHRGVPHWGQLMQFYTARDVLDLHGEDLAVWRRKLTQLIREGGGGRNTFSNSFTSTYNLEPLDDTAITAVRLAVTVGGDSLGDTDWLRHDVSADFARVALLDGTEFEVSLNDEGATWSAGSIHTRDVPVDPGTLWGDVRSVSIRHQAAGNDWNADNWTMNVIVISVVLEDGEVREMFRRADTPIWQFRKNDHQIWQHDFV